MKKTLHSISMCVCAAIILSMLTPLSYAHAVSNPLLAEESEPISEIYWCSDEDAFLNLFPPSNSITTETLDPTGNYQYSITESPDNSALIDLTIEINGQKISASGDGVISSLNDGTRFLDGKLHGQFDTPTESYSVLIAFQKILGQEDEFIGVTFTTTMAEEREFFFVDFGVPVLSVNAVEQTKANDSEDKSREDAVVYGSGDTDFHNYWSINREYVSVEGYRDHNSAEGRVVAFDIYSDVAAVENLDFGKGDLYGTSIGEVSIALEGNHRNNYSKIDSFFELPVGLKETVGVGEKISFSDFADVMINIIGLRYPGTSAAIEAIRNEVKRAYENLRGVHHVEISMDDSRYAYVCDFNYLRPDLGTFACLDEAPLTVMYELKFTSANETRYPYLLTVTMDYYVVYIDNDLERFYTHYVEAETLEEEIAVTPLGN